jgi:hypothetical protein
VVTSADEYRQNARDCLERAREANSLNDHAYWTGMAQLWLQFAQHLEGLERLVEDAKPLTGGFGDSSAPMGLN